MRCILNTGKQPLWKRVRFAIRWVYTGIMCAACAIVASVILTFRKLKIIPTQQPQKE